MKKIFFLLVLFTTLHFTPQAGVSTFAKHNIEVQVTPSSDYFIYQKGNQLEDEPYKSRYPFVGFGFGANYIFRPVKVVGVSTGLNFKMQGEFYRYRHYPFLQSSYIRYKGNQHIMYINIPIYLHLYKEMTNSTFEFAVGPDFNIPIFYRSVVTEFNANGDEISTSKESEKLTKEARKSLAAFGLSIFLGGEVHLFDQGNLFIGPQIQFLNLVSFDKDTRDYEKTVRKDFFVSLGIKFGFRFHK